LLPALAGFMKSDLGWSAAATGGAFSVYHVVFGAFCMGAGLLVVRFGPRLLLGAGALTVVAACVLLAFTEALWQFYALAALFAAGIAGGGVVTGPQLAANWLHRRRGLVIGLLLASTAIGGSLLTMVSERVIAAYGSWRPAWLVVATLVMVSVLLAAFLVRNRPEDNGQLIDGVNDLSELAPLPERGRSRVYKCLDPWTPREAFRTRSLWLIIVAFGFCDYAYLGTLAHQMTYLTDEAGIGVTVAASALALTIGTTAVGKVVGGWLADRVEPANTLAGMSLLLALALFLLLTWHSSSSLYVYVVFLGLGYGGAMAQTTAVLPNYFGRRHAGSILGLSMGIAVFLGALSTTLTGVIRDATGSYVPAFLVMLVLMVIGAGCAFLARVPRPKRAPSARALAPELTD
ncbi:MAG: MFS transporter, partial [Anaerolineae bacterium]